jgi:hypothetical protein
MAAEQDFQYDVFLSHSAKDKVVVRPLAERLRQDGVNRFVPALHPSAFILLPSFAGSLPQFMGFQEERDLIRCCRWN